MLVLPLPSLFPWLHPTLVCVCDRGGGGGPAAMGYVIPGLGMFDMGYVVS